MIVRHEEGRAGRGADNVLDHPRAAQALGGRGVDARIQKMAALAVACAALAALYASIVLTIKLGVMFGQAFIY